MKHIQEFGSYAAGLGCEVLYDEPMSCHTTFRIGGPADIFITVNSISPLQKIYSRAFEEGIPVFPLGNGSDLLVADAGVRGAVVTLGSGFRKTSLISDTELECGAGAPLSSVCRFAKEHALTGLEFAWGIPGSAGGAAYMNAGAYGHTVSEAITSCSHVAKNGQCGTFKRGQFDFGYRQSVYMKMECMIISLRIELKHGVKDEIGARMDDLLARRKSKQPLELPSAGSIFKRPKGHFAGALIQQCGLKGRRVGGAAVSEKHAGFIVNLGGASCDDVRRLIKIIQDTVLRETGVWLECEVKFVG
ncbi:MAG TPA: UDP-N-acetylenolpyruvoylglucosamine reductase [Ruminococcaceae bacterium]|jgi:UDP-N-acetylmuramate dehydrogenase|nr:UDP-N-acetylenolpyruvoylglucosamine reductase [Oscillospiraceae bacterium]